MKNITSKQATQIATEYLRSITGNYAIPLVIEEVDFHGGNAVWRVTLSYPEDALDPFNFYSSNKGGKRIFKIFEIDASSGEVMAMKIK